MTTNPFTSKAAEEAAIARYAAMTARFVRQDWRMAGADLQAAPATEVYDSCRDFAYDVLACRESIHGDLVDLILIDVTEAAVALVLS